MSALDFTISCGRELLLSYLDDLVSLDALVHTQLGLAYADTAWSKKNFELELDEKWSLSHVAISPSQELLGFLVASKEGQVAHIHRFAVSSKTAGKGVGRALYNSATEAAIYLGIKRISLVVSVENNQANHFYKSLGMTKLDGKALQDFSRRFTGAVVNSGDVLMLTVGESMFRKYAYIQDLEDA